MLVRATPGDDLVFSKIAGPKSLVEKLDRSRKDVVPYPRIGSLALRLCRVADGRIDAAFAAGQSRDWDIAAADLIVHEANGKMTSLGGEPILYNRAEITHDVLAAAGCCRHARILARFREYPPS
jgi:myo-inositol-1(or 4)-monophosphatase